MKPRNRRRAYALFTILAPSAFILTMMLTGCSGTDQETGNDIPSWIAPHTVNLPDGRKVLCVWEKDGYGGGLSCDWSRAQ
ncbi:membrane protein [Mycobacterium phage Beezoo]|uniref:Membrane protein n=1 Tax=Mycobacterium phage Beezoo TaxID=2250355 RepID=A0A2Z5H8C8_9CAUD|nr:membrane protein [Mycobacterium phage Beezoo]AXC35812.1 membrane protein [Mycobacterium phage Beezoo]